MMYTVPVINTMAKTPFVIIRTAENFKHSNQYHNSRYANGLQGANYEFGQVNVDSTENRI